MVYGQKGVQIWNQSIDAGKFRVRARMIRDDHGTGKIRYEDPRDSKWEMNSIFVLADGKVIQEVKGKITFEFS